MRDLDTGRMSPELARTVRRLRRAPGVSDDWRRRTLAAIAAAGRPHRGVEWRVRPWMAIAAGLSCVALGASLFAVATPRHARVGEAVRATTAPLVHFTFDAPQARSVSLVGDFNAWRAGVLPLRRSADGRTWTVEVPLLPGRYAYSFVVDGSIAPDPAAPRATGDDFGTPSSVVLVRGS
ncbi:MAG TPA: isoamylase early set domain-containing protein [Gemmatimonadaceae bacterium]|nr:isoamylase early set domain-containing protein [Gemmatimonadaceae bacterium]